MAGWAQRQRDLGSLIFIDLRDRTGIVQLAFDDKTDRNVFDKAFTVRGEYVLMANGTVRERSSKNAEIPTGEIEIEVTELKILAASETPPFEIVEDSQTSELMRLKYRYLDLRRPDLQRNILMRHRISKITRDYFDENGFIEIETPIDPVYTEGRAIFGANAFIKAFRPAVSRSINSSRWSRDSTGIFNRGASATKTTRRCNEFTQIDLECPSWT